MAFTHFYARAVELFSCSILWEKGLLLLNPGLESTSSLARVIYDLGSRENETRWRTIERFVGLLLIYVQISAA